MNRPRLALIATTLIVWLLFIGALWVTAYVMLGGFD